jgi:hypothetical protein
MTDDDDPLAWLEDERRQPGGSRVEFQQQLEACRDKLVELSSAVSEAILPVTDAFLEADAAAAEDYRTTDRGVSAGCVALEEACYLLLARQGPVGGDLRRVVATVRCVTNVERSSNLLAHVARSLAWVHPPSMPEVLRRTLRELAEKALAQFERDLRIERIRRLPPGQLVVVFLWNGDVPAFDARGAVQACHAIGLDTAIAPDPLQIVTEDLLAVVVRRKTSSCDEYVGHRSKPGIVVRSPAIHGSRSGGSRHASESRCHNRSVCAARTAVCEASMRARFRYTQRMSRQLPLIWLCAALMGCGPGGAQSS